MSEEKTTEKKLKKPGRPRKTVATANVSKNIIKNITENIIEEKHYSPQLEGTPVSKPAVKKTPRKASASAKVNTDSNVENDTKKTKKSIENGNEEIFQAKSKKEKLELVDGVITSIAVGTSADVMGNKTKSERARTKTALRNKEKASIDSEKLEPPKFKYVSSEYVLDLAQNKLTQDSTSPKRKPGRPIKKQVKQPVLSLDSSSLLPAAGNEMLATKKQAPLAIKSHGRKALGETNKYALEEYKTQTLPVAIDETQVATLSEANIESKNNVADEITMEKRPWSRGRKGHNARQNSTDSHRAKPENSKFTDMGVADFVAGVHGTSAYVGPDSLGEYGEKAALGVMGIIDEAPVVDALLPLVIDGDKEREPKNSRRSRPRRRSKDRLLKPAPAPITVEPSVDYGLEAPIAEGGELSRLEAEATIKKHNKKKAQSAKVEEINRVLYVSSVPDEQVEVVITENGVVSEYFVEMSHQAKIRGNIYKGIINNVDTNLQAAFVNFGCGKNGFLQIDEVHPEYWLTHHTEGGKYPPIQKVLKVGQEVLVQVVKEPAGSKGAFLTTWISLAGRFLVLTPGQEQIGVSRKVEDNVERSRLRDLLTGINPGENMGVIIRTASEGASKTNIQNDLKFLQRAWTEIQKKVVIEEAPNIIYQEADLASRAVRDYLSDDIDEVWVDSENVYDALKDLVDVIFPNNKDILKVHKDTRHTLWERFNILRQLEEVTKREVVLPSGGRLVFDQTEALMAIDINSGKTQGKSNFESMVFRTNMEATEAIARHLRLRDIGGQVVIDFIEMRDRGHCRDVEKAMRNAMKRDRARHDVGRLSSFGLLELVRQRTGTSAISISSEPCPHCRGTGFRRNLEWQSQGVLREIKSKLSGKNVPACYVHHVEQEVAFYLLNKKRDRLSELEDKFSVKIEIHVK